MPSATVRGIYSPRDLNDLGTPGPVDVEHVEQEQDATRINEISNPNAGTGDRRQPDQALLRSNEDINRGSEASGPPRPGYLDAAYAGGLVGIDWRSPCFG